MATEAAKRVGQRILQARREMGLNQRELAERFKTGDNESAVTSRRRSCTQTNQVGLQRVLIRNPVKAVGNEPRDLGEHVVPCQRARAVYDSEVRTIGDVTRAGHREHPKHTFPTRHEPAHARKFGTSVNSASSQHPRPKKRTVGPSGDASHRTSACFHRPDVQ